MDWWKETRDIEIYFEGEQRNPDRVEYQLYEPNFITAMKYIFQSVLDEKGKKEDRDGKKRKQTVAKSNILSFIGARGAGKTTAMSEFCRILKELGLEEAKDWWIERAIDSPEDRKVLARKSFRFHVLDPIDASLLDDRDDLLELIISGLSQEYEKMMEQRGFRRTAYSGTDEKINQLFGDLLTMYRASSKDRRDEQEDYTIYTVKRMLRGSGRITKLIGELITELLKLENEKDCEYFVIAIDDLDLNLSQGYQMLEQLQKYCSDPRILILVTMDYNQMWRVCAEYFLRGMWETDENDATAGNELHSHRLASDFMTKVFPLQQRLFLPDMKKQGKRMLVQLKGNEDIPIKEFIMEKVADRMRIFYDAKGSKTHFCEPDTVRKLVEYNNFLNSLIPVDFEKLIPVEQLTASDAEDNEKLLRKYDQNHNRFNWDIMERQAQTTLNSRQHSVFRQLLEFPLEKRMVYFVGMAQNSEGGQLRMVTVSEEDCDRYSYGDCLEQIYTWGRKEYSNKPFISCLIASFTSEIVREYVNFRYLYDPGRRKRSKERLKAFLGMSFSNKWVMDGMLPNEIVSVNRDEHTVAIGYDQNVNINVALVFRIENLSVLKSGKNKGMVKEAELRAWLEKESIVETLECVDMFLSVGKDRDYAGPEPQFGLGRPRSGVENDRSKKREFVSVRFASGGVLDIMGFVGKSLDYEKQKNTLHGRIVKGLNLALKAYFEGGDMAYNESRMETLLERILGDYSIFKKYWRPEWSFEAALPFYDLDLMYNIIKRIRKEQTEVAKKEEIYDRMLDLYQNIEKALAEQEKEYKYAGMNYSKIFAACPYIEALRRFKQDKKTGVIDQITAVLYNSYDFSMLSAGSPEDPRD